MAKKAQTTLAKHREIIEQPLDKYAEWCMRIFGLYTLEQRAIPDYRDGFKPVHRRVHWAAHELGLRASKDAVRKSAKIVGDAMGNYHPHGDSAIYEALVNMVHTAQPLIFGAGNFGTLTDREAAMRYTEARLSHYSDAVFFRKEFLDVTDTSINYDGSREEPVILPANLPNLLLNGVFGIAMGGRSIIPAFEAEGVITLTRKAIGGKDITIKDCMKHLMPRTSKREGGVPYLEEKEYLDELEAFYKTGTGSILWVPVVDIDVKHRSILVSGFAPRVALNVQTVLNKLAEDPEVQDVLDESDIDEETGEGKQAFRVTLRKNVDPERVEDALLEVQQMFEASQPLVFAINERTKNDDALTDAEFEMTNMPDFFRRWAKWRIELERKSIKYEIETQEGKLARDELLLLGVLNRETLIKATNAKDYDAAVKLIVKGLKIDEQQAKDLLELKIRQIMALEEAGIRERIKQHKATIKRLKSEHKEPTDRINGKIDDAIEFLT